MSIYDKIGTPVYKLVYAENPVESYIRKVTITEQNAAQVQFDLDLGSVRSRTFLSKEAAAHHFEVLLLGRLTGLQQELSALATCFNFVEANGLEVVDD